MLLVSGRVYTTVHSGSVVRFMNFDRTVAACDTVGCVSLLATQLLRETDQIGKDRKVYQNGFQTRQKMKAIRLHNVRRAVRFFSFAKRQCLDTFTRSLL